MTHNYKWSVEVTCNQMLLSVINEHNENLKRTFKGVNELNVNVHSLGSQSDLQRTLGGTFYYNPAYQTRSNENKIEYIQEFFSTRKGWPNPLNQSLYVSHRMNKKNMRYSGITIADMK